MKSILNIFLGFLFATLTYSAATPYFDFKIKQEVPLSKITPGDNNTVLKIEGGVPVWSEAVAITEDRTINVPSDYASVKEAMDYLLTKRIFGNTEVIIQVADGTYNLTEAITLYHPDGRNIKLVGNISSPSSVVLDATSSSSRGINVIKGAIKEISGFRIIGNSGSYIGVNISNRAFTELSNLEISGFNYGILVDVNSGAIVDSILVENGGYQNIRVSKRSYMHITNSTIQNNSNAGGISVLRAAILLSENNLYQGITGDSISLWAKAFAESNTDTFNGVSDCNVTDNSYSSSLNGYFEK